MTKAKFLGREFLALSACHWNGGCRRRSDNLDRRGPNFDLARVHLRIPRLGRASRHDSFNEHDAFDANRGRRGDGTGGGPLSSEGHLHHALAVAKVKEDDAAEIA